MATVTSKGQITLPRTVRNALGLEQGSEVDFVIEPDGVRLRRRVSRAQLEKWAGCLPATGEFAEVDALMDELRGA
jgi:AbrB family looped-hinge helix DNA binding protein